MFLGLFFKALLSLLVGFVWFFGSASLEQAVLFAVLLFVVLLIKPIRFQSRQERRENRSKQQAYRHKKRALVHKKIQRHYELKKASNRMENRLKDE